MKNDRDERNQDRRTPEPRPAEVQDLTALLTRDLNAWKLAKAAVEKARRQP